MNLAAIARAAVSPANPDTDLQIKFSEGYLPGDASNGFKQVPKYKTVDCKGNVQALQYKDLIQVEGLNLNGTRRKIYLYGVAEATVRALMKGGDVITDAAGNVWLTAMVLEQWLGWCSVAVTLQLERD